MSHTKEDLAHLVSLSLSEKIQISTARIIEWYENWGGQVYVSFSGGKDSTVLLDLVRKIYPDVPAVFSDTGLEFPELREFVKTFENVTWVKPKMTFSEVIKKYGYPIISKQIANTIHGAIGNPNSHRGRLLQGIEKMPSGQKSFYNCEKWSFMLKADFPVGDNCCNVMKKNPCHKYEKDTGRKPYIGIMTEESQQRRRKWLRQGCNVFEQHHQQSNPMAFWTEQDVLRYIKSNNLPYASVYGELIEDEDGHLRFTQYKRTGCVFCGYGCHLEKAPNRFQIMAETHPQLYDYCMRGGKYENGKWVPDKGLGMAKVLDYINVQWWNTEEQRDKYRKLYKEKEEAEYGTHEG